MMQNGLMSKGTLFDIVHIQHNNMVHRNCLEKVMEELGYEKM